MPISPSNDSRVTKSLEKLEGASIRMHETLPRMLTMATTTNQPQPTASNATGLDNEHMCGGGCSATNISLLALNYIIMGKGTGNDKSCIDDDLSADDDFARSSSSQNCADKDDEDDDRNPLLKTRLLGESSIVPLLSQALAEMLSAVFCQLRQQQQQQKPREQYGNDYPDDEFCPLCATVL